MTLDTPLTNPTESDLACAVQENLFSLFRAMAQALAGAEIVEHDGLSYHHAYPSNPMFKGDWRTRLSHDQVDKAIDETLTWFTARKAPFLFWWTGPDTTPGDLGARLQARGLLDMADSYCHLTGVACVLFFTMLTYPWKHYIVFVLAQGGKSMKSGYSRWLLAVLIGIVALLPPIIPASSQSADETEQRKIFLSGRIQSGDSPIAFLTVTLYRTGTGHGAVALGTAQVDGNGVFGISYRRPSDPDAILYLIAEGGPTPEHGRPSRPVKGPVRLATVLGGGSVPAAVVINEQTTVATAYTMAQFIDGQSISGNSPGVQNSAVMLRNLVDLTTGQVGAVLGNPPNGMATSTMREFNALANMLAACVNASAACASLFDLATPPRGRAPRDTLQAAVNIAHYPWQNVTPLFDQSRIQVLYQPALEKAPDAWTLAIKFIGNGHEFDGAGNMAVDKDGSIWVTNNYNFNADHSVPACGGNYLIKLNPAGFDAPGAPYFGGGLNGAGWGITLDPKGNVWVGNFGFQGQGCTSPPPANAVSQFSPAGQPLSPDTGFTQGNISAPQGTVSDQRGNIWIANCGNDTITQFPKGNPDKARNFSGIGLSKPFGAAIDAKGNLWVTGNGNDAVAALAPDGSPIAGSPFTGGGIQTPLGIAIDSRGNVWVSNSGILEIPCPLSRTPTSRGSSVTQLKPNGKPAQGSPFTGGGLQIPWGIAVDGNDNIWVANFGGRRLTQLCGARPSACPPGYHTGDPISPDTGYFSDALDRNTAVVVDPSGNVWLANNWLIDPVQTNPGGDGMVVFVGLAAPVKTPMRGPAVGFDKDDVRRSATVDAAALEANHLYFPLVVLDE